jgi:hypothetical protein
MYRHDVGMVQPCENAGFGEKRFRTIGMSNALWVRQLDGYRTIEVIVVGKIDSPERAVTQGTDDAVAPDLGGSAF